MNPFPLQKYFWPILLVSCLLLLFPFLGAVHLFDWDEINFAEAAREMVVSGNYLRVQINYEPFWEKPPFFFWLQAGSMHIFGINDYAARFPNALAGVATLALAWHTGRRWQSSSLGWWWTLAILGSILPHLYFRSGIIDPWFNLFIFYGLLQWIRISSEEAEGYQMRILAIGGLVLGLGILTKGPVAYLLLGLTVLADWVFRWSFSLKRVIQWSIFSLWSLLPFTIWLAWETLLHGTWFIKTFLAYTIRLASTEDAGHGGFPGYHFVVLLIGCFPASWLALRHWSISKARQEQSPAWWMFLLIVVVLTVFSLVQSKIVHYSSLAYLPLTYLAAASAEHWMKQRQQIPPLLHWGICIGGTLLLIAFIALPILGHFPEKLIPLFSKDPFAQGNLEASIEWPWYTFIPGFLLAAVMSGYLYRRQKQPVNSLLFLLIGNVFVITAALAIFPGRIEGYSQRAAISFYQSLEGQKAYVLTHGFKSYAHLYYPKVAAPAQGTFPHRDTLLYGQTDRPVYIVTKVQYQEDLKAIPGLRKIKGENGFVFFVRDSVK